VGAVSGFFRSRWVDPPPRARETQPHALAAGFRAAGVAAGIKPNGGLDVGMLVCDAPEAVSAARFTTNARVGAPVAVSREAELDSLRAVVANSGCSNVGDGERGLETARATQREAARLLGIGTPQVGLASTGAIGDELPRDRVLAGVGAAAKALGPDADGLSQAILTTDAGPKRACLEVDLGGGTVRLSAQAKGAGMISPRFATMFCFVQTDAAVAAETLDLLTGVCVKRSFDRISVDGQLSTSDTVFVISSGASGVTVEPASPDELVLGQALDALLRQLAVEIVRDGEGAARAGRIVVRGGEGVERVARSIADSPLVKTALHGAYPGFGRVLQAAGQAWPEGLAFVCDLTMGGVRVVSAGDAVPLDEREQAALREGISAEEVDFELTMPGEGEETEVFFSDLSPQYATFNAEYLT
jgi:glutamate N-acetyltransferase/amino-acid N-acetyltransferase